MRYFRPRSSLWALLALGLAIRLGYAAYALRTGISEPFSDGYEFIAKNLLEGRGYSGVLGKAVPTAAREPGLPLLIAAVYSVAGYRPMAVLAALSLLSVATAFLLGLIARRLAGDLAGWIALWIGLFYPYGVFYSAYFYRETLLLFLVAGTLYAAGEALRKPAVVFSALTGLGLGCCAATMSTFLLIDAVVGAWLLWKLRARLRAACVLLVLMALPPGAWISRNYLVFHRLIPGSTIGGFNLYTSLVVPEEWRGTEREHEFEMADAHWDRIHRMGSLMEDDGSQQEAFVAAARERIAAQPGRFAAHVVKQALKLWRLYPYERRYHHSYLLIKALSLLSDGWLIPLGLWGLWRLRRRAPEAGFSLVLLGAATATYALVSAIVRYRLPLMAPLIVGAACAIVELRNGRESGFIRRS